MKARICGVEVEADFLNPEIRKKYETCVEAVAESCKKAMKCKKVSDAIHIQCQAVIQCLDDMFGEGSAEKVLGKSTDLMACLDAFEEFCDIYEKYVDPLLTERVMAAKAKASLKSG